MICSRAGIVEGHWTALAARRASLLAAHVTPQEGEGLLRELGNMSPSKSSLDRLPKALSARWEAQREHCESALRERTSVPEAAVSMAVSLDGVMVPMKDGARAAHRVSTVRRAGRSPGGRQQMWRRNDIWRRIGLTGSSTIGGTDRSECLIRELQHVIDRAAILSRGPEVEIGDSLDGERRGAAGTLEMAESATGEPAPDPRRGGREPSRSLIPGGVRPRARARTSNCPEEAEPGVGHG